MSSYLPPIRRNINAVLSESTSTVYENNHSVYCTQLEKFKTNVKSHFLSESMTKLLKNSLPKNVDESYINIGKNMINKFIVDEGVDKLLSRFSQTSVFLAEMANLVTESYGEVMEKCDITSYDTDKLYIMPSSDQKFFDKLDNLDMSHVSNEIAKRVSAAEEDFIKSNVEDRKKMEDAAEDTKSKIENYVGKTSDIAEAVRGEYQLSYKRQIHDISSRPKGILEAMILKAGSEIMKEDTMREQYTTETGKFDANKTIDTCEVLYTVLEMINTANMRPINAEYIQEVINAVS